MLSIIARLFLAAILATITGCAVNIPTNPNFNVKQHHLKDLSVIFQRIDIRERDTSVSPESWKHEEHLEQWVTETFKQNIRIQLAHKGYTLHFPQHEAPLPPQLRKELDSHLSDTYKHSGFGNTKHYGVDQPLTASFGDKIKGINPKHSDGVLIIRYYGYDSTLSSIVSDLTVGSLEVLAKAFTGINIATHLNAKEWHQFDITLIDGKNGDYLWAHGSAGTFLHDDHWLSNSLMKIAFTNIPATTQYASSMEKHPELVELKIPPPAAATITEENKPELTNKIITNETLQSNNGTLQQEAQAPVQSQGLKPESPNQRYTERAIPQSSLATAPSTISSPNYTERQLSYVAGHSEPTIHRKTENKSIAVACKERYRYLFSICPN